jgi:tRNA uridine 5-carbamoylmethylation protein Kti12
MILVHNMIKTKLILIEGLPGAGKTTTAIHLGTDLQEQGLSCRWYLEKDEPHPIACLEFFQAWQIVAQKLFQDWPYRKIRVDNPHADWFRAYQQLSRDLQIG